MPTPNPRPRGDATLVSTRRGDVNNIQQVRRLLTTPPRVSPPVASGGIAGMAEVVATPGTVEMPAGYGNLAYEGVTYGAPFDPNGGPAPSWLTVEGYQITVTPGFYIPVCYLRVIWDSQADAPAGFGPYIQGGNDAVHNDYSTRPGAPYPGGRWGCVQIVNHGPTYLTEETPLHAELRAIGGSAPGGSNPAQSALLWTITKLS